MLFNMKTKKVEKVITTLKDRIGHSLTLFHMGGRGADYALLQILFFIITSVRDGAEPRNFGDFL